MWAPSRLACTLRAVQPNVWQTADRPMLQELKAPSTQAEQQLPGGWTLMRMATPGCPEIVDWLADSLPPGARVGIDPFVHTVRVLGRGALHTPSAAE